MSKGLHQRPSRASTSVIAIREQLPREGKTNGIGGAIGEDSPQRRCWRFALIETTDISRAAKVGDVVTTTFSKHRSAAIVESEHGSIGFAPSRPTTSMIEFVEKNGGSITGRIVSVDLANIVVKVCWER